VSETGIKTCPECAEQIKLEAKVCRYCGTTFSVVQVGYCVRDHKVVATSDLGVCVICNSRLIDVHVESEEIAGPTVGVGEKSSATAPASAAAIAPVVMPESAEGAKETKEPEEEEEEEPEEEEEGEPGEEEEEAPEEEEESASPRLASVEPKSGLPSSQPPGVAPGLSWSKPSFTVEPTTEKTEPVVAGETPEGETPQVAAKPPQAFEPRPNDVVTERLAAFGRQTTPTPTPPIPPPASGPPVAPPPGPPATTPPVITPSKPVSSPGPEQAARAAVSAPAARVDLRTEAAKEEAEQVKAVGADAPAAVAGQRLGIVPSLAHRIAHPLYQLAAIAAILVWLLEFYWDRSLRGTSNSGSKALSHLAVATYGSGQTLLIAVQVAALAAVCGLLAPTRLLPKGWFRSRYVSRAFTQELEAKVGVKMLYNKKWYLPKLICAFVLWAAALALFVAEIAAKSSIVPKVGGYVTAAALIVGFASSAVLLVRRTPLVSVDEQGRVGSKS
jgi:hypothetical protein